MSNFEGARLPAPTMPRNVEQIVKAAKEYEYNAQVPVRYWLRTASALLKEADIYMREGDDETTYLLLFRHAHLILAHLEAHPETKEKAIKVLLDQARREVNTNLKVLDDLKPRINQRYERFASIIREREQRRTTQSKLEYEPPQEETLRQTNKRKVQQLHGHENSDLAVRLAQQEFKRRADARESVSTPLSSPSQPIHEGDELSRRLQAIRARVDSGTLKDHGHDSGRRRIIENTEFNYPSVKAQQSHQIPEYVPPIQNPRITNFNHTSSIPPSLPPKPVDINSSAVPHRPEKVGVLAKSDRSEPKPTTETTYTFTPTAFLENNTPLRTLFLPPTLRTTFLRIAHKNTQANLETCGFLAGTLISNALFVSKLIIPAQVATSDTCEMTNESQLFDYVDSGADLMILGWIHTHPSQTCFMSSRDLHTHAGYQMMLPESVAIVCAPSKGDTYHGGDWGVYRLTDPPGKMAILNCTKPGIFHPHDVDNVYTDALRPGHVVEAKGLEFEVVDLRTA